MELMTKWYTIRNAPGSQNISGHEEWILFLRMILKLLGYNIEALPLTSDSFNTNNDTPAKSKKQRTLDMGSDEDWTFMLKSSFSRSRGNHIALSLGLKNKIEKYMNHECSDDSASKYSVDINSLLFPYIYDIIFAFHLVYEVCLIFYLIVSLNYINFIIIYTYY